LFAIHLVVVTDIPSVSHISDRVQPASHLSWALSLNLLVTYFFLTRVLCGILNFQSSLQRTVLKEAVIFIYMFKYFYINYFIVNVFVCGVIILWFFWKPIWLRLEDGDNQVLRNVGKSATTKLCHHL